MIAAIQLENVATFGAPPERLHDLSRFNFIFGANATGKTTIGRVIGDEASYPSCIVSWQGGTKLQPLVFNPDFIEKNFNLSTELKGVFTLGEKQVDTLKQIASAKETHDLLTRRIEDLTTGLQGVDGNGGKKGEVLALETKLKDKCWIQKQKHDAALQGAFEGFRANAERFRDKVLEQWATNSEALVTLDEILKKAETVYGPTSTAETPTLLVDATGLVAHELNPILKKRVIGRSDVDLAAMITKLGNSDWVQQGRPFYEVNGSVCPFCQQATQQAFAESLSEYFDETFLSDSKAIEDLIQNYSTDSARLSQELASIIAAPARHLDVEKLKIEKELLDSKVTINLQRLAGKQREASGAVELESLSTIAAAIRAVITSGNTAAAEHNKMVANLTKERSTLTAQVWRYVVEELMPDLSEYKTARDALDKAIRSMSGQVVSAKAEKAKTVLEIRELEKQATSVQPTIDGINAVLASFGFGGFSLAKAANGTSYKLVRPDGSDARATLSEGERSFVTFLYFYHLLKGSIVETGMTTDRVVVFDDPVSSLDSDVLFIVGSLIKGLFDEVRAGTGHIKQVFVLTHNVYFHKEVAFNSRRKKDVAMSEETFWVIRKPGFWSKLERHVSNPIKTSYELLWAELRRPDRSNLTIQNTMRRILENYFRILGGVDPDKICGLFEGKERIMCRSLFSWVHDGSHFAHDDIYVAMDDAMVDGYLALFKSIFERAEHIGHYNMMMGDASGDSSTTAATPTVR